MSNCEKLLRAFIEAQGYSIEDGKATAGDVIDVSRSSAVYSTLDMREMYPNKHIECPVFGGNWVVSEWVTSYKITKTKLQQGLDDNKVSAPNPRLTDEELEALLDPTSPISGLIIADRDYDYMKEIKSLVIESELPKSVIIDLIEGIHE